MAEQNGTGRFPMPTTPWITAQVPAELFPLFGFRGERTPEDYRDEIEYLYPLAYPDGTPYRMPVLVEYIADPDEPPVAFVIGDAIELDGILVTVETWESRDIEPSGGMSGYLHHQVLVRLPEGAAGNG